MVLITDAPTTPSTAYAEAVSTVLAMDVPMPPTTHAVADSIVLIVDASFNRSEADTLVIVVDALTAQLWEFSTALKMDAPKVVWGPTRWVISGCSEDIGSG
jgi:hypothetical protein